MDIPSTQQAELNRVNESRNRRSVPPRLQIIGTEGSLSDSVMSTEPDLPKEMNEHYAKFNKPAKPDMLPPKTSLFSQKEKKFYVQKIDKSELKALKALQTMKR